MRIEAASFISGKDQCSATLYWPDGVDGRPPVIVMCLGLGGEQYMRLDGFAERFCAQGFVCVTFDYRGWGKSEGTPRHVASIRGQQADIRACLDWIRCRDDLSGKRPVLWGVSFGGGHALTVATDYPDIRAVVAHVPFVDGVAATANNSLWMSLKLTAHGVLDLLCAPFGKTHCVPLASDDGSAAMLSTPESLPGFMRCVPAGLAWDNAIAARIAFALPRYRPTKVMKKVKCPVFITAGTEDSLVPIASIRKAAAKPTRCKIVEFAGETHFSMYFDEAFEKAVAAQCDFLGRIPA